MQEGEQTFIYSQKQTDKTERQTKIQTSRQTDILTDKTDKRQRRQPDLPNNNILESFETGLTLNIFSF
jgi:hypothetical protein